MKHLKRFNESKVKHTIEMIKSVVTEAGYKLEINSGNKHYMITFKPVSEQKYEVPKEI